MVNYDGTGEGTHTLADGRILKGNFNKWILANGMVSFPNGDQYRGDLIKSQPHGKGLMNHAGGDWYTGDWVHGTKQGYGDFFDKEKVRVHKKIKFTNGKPHLRK